MKKSNSLNIILFSCYILNLMLGCLGENHTEFDKNNISYYVKNFRNYTKIYDSLGRRQNLVKYYGGEKQESLIFNNEGILVKYIFYNTVVSKPRFEIDYFLNGKILKLNGKPLYIVSNNFKEDVYASDTFQIQIFLAKPPHFKSKFSVYKIVDSIGFLDIGRNIDSDNNVSLFIGKVDKVNTVEKYCVVSNLTSVLEHSIFKNDTAYFNIKTR